MKLKNKLLKITHISLCTAMFSVIPYSTTICIALIANKRFNPVEVLGIFIGTLVLSIVLVSLLVQFIHYCAGADKSKMKRYSDDAEGYVLTALILTPILGIILSAVLKKCQVVESVAASDLMAGLGISLSISLVLLTFASLCIFLKKPYYQVEDIIHPQPSKTHDSQRERGSSSSRGQITNDRTQPLLQGGRNQHQLQNAEQPQPLSHAQQYPDLLLHPVIKQHCISSSAELYT